MKFFDRFKKGNSGIAILFADIADSTKLYDKLGDTVAQQKIASCISMMTTFVNRHSGEVIKTIGDEIMCRFPTADNAVTAAKHIQDSAEKQIRFGRSQLRIKIGIHYGHAITRRNDLFGDAINVAARVVRIAKASQIIVTKALADKMSATLEIDMRQFDSVQVKGKEDEIVVYEILWEDDNENVTVISEQSSPRENNAHQLILITHAGTRHTIPPETTGFSMGRGPQNNCVIDSDLASRTHALIKYQRGKFVLEDQSSNGTYVQDQDGQDIYLRREEIPLMTRGTISLGEPVATNENHLLRYQCS